jgi:hypothetical protein
MKKESGRTVRCAIDTRVSSDSGLNQDFNSLDAQHEASQAYIKSQAHAGWTLIRTRYDDDGYSGGSTERPAFQRLLEDVKARKVDIIVVYKVDRLTRSLADFAKLVELFDAHGVSFVSVTQQFNTTTSMGRLLRFDSLREDIKGATVAFRHDVLRDWAVGFLLHEDEGLLNALAMDKPLPPGLARGIEIAARLALDSDATGARWQVLLAAVERDGSHGGWKRPVLLALPRSEQAFALFQRLNNALLHSDGRRLGEIIRLMIAVESEPLAKVIARVAGAMARG